MYRTCLYCHADLGANDAIEAFSVGRRLAFDANRGRLWIVCTACERWNLTPLEERWEAIEECEQRFRDERKRVTSDNIGLAQLDEGTELVRIGDPLKTEYAAWRYGDQFGRRQRRLVLKAAGVTALGTAAIVGGLAIGAISVGAMLAYPVFERYRKERRRNRLIARIPRWVGEAYTVRGEHLNAVRLVPDRQAEGGWKLQLAHDAGDEVLVGVEAINALALLTPRINIGGAPKRVVRAATRRLEAFDDPTQYLLPAAHVAEFKGPGQKTVSRLPLVTRLAIEMAANEENERHAMEGDLGLLELDWREAEEIAAIADGLLVPEDVERRFAELKRDRDESIVDRVSSVD